RPRWYATTSRPTGNGRRASRRHFRNRPSQFAVSSLPNTPRDIYLAVVAAVGAARNPRWAGGGRERVSEGGGKGRGVRAGGRELSIPRQLPAAGAGGGKP